MDAHEKYADKIAKLLRKAEDPAATAAEAEAFVAKAQALMTEYAIDEAMVAKARGENAAVQEKIVEETIEYAGSYQAALYDIGSAIAKANDCRTLIARRQYPKPLTVLYVIGFESDVARVRMLDTSLQIQATVALARYAREGNIPGYLTATQKYKERRSFLFGFAAGLSTKLQEARKAGEKAAAANEAQRSGVSQGDAAESVALVVRGRKDRVNDWVDESYGRGLRKVSRRYSHGSYGAHGAGHAAGRRADVGGGKVAGGNAGALNR